MKYLVADIITEYTPKYEFLKYFSQPFLYSGSKPADLALALERPLFERHLRFFVPEVGKPRTESFSMGSLFNREALRFGALLLHSSAFIYRGGAYLFSAPSGGGKSTLSANMRRLLKSEFSYINDDKPVLRLKNSIPIAYGTPFDGGSGIAYNRSAPLKAVVFVEQSQDVSLKELSPQSAVPHLYRNTLRTLGTENARQMLSIIDAVIKSDLRFYLYSCTADFSSAEYLANYIF